MIFKRFLTKKKPHPVPEDQDNLIRIVRNHEDTAARRDACRRISRLSALRELATTDVDAGIREIAFAHYRKLLCGLLDDPPPMAERLNEIAVLADPRILEQVAGAARESEVRSAAISKIESPTALAACALNDALAANRSAAVERLEDKQALELVVRNIGKKDKRVYRVAREKLKDIVEREALPERIRSKCAELCEKLEHLGRFESWVKDRSILDLLDRQWAEIESQTEAQWQTRYRDLRNRFLTAYEEYRREHEAQIAADVASDAIRRECRSLLDELAACTSLTDETEIAALTERISTRWLELEPLAENEQSAMERRYAALSSQASERLEELAAQRKRDKRLKKLLAAAEKALEQSKSLESKRIRKLFDDAKPILNAPGVNDTLAARFSKAREQLDERLRKQKGHAEQRLVKLPGKLDELEAALENGELRHAEPLYQSLLACLDLVEASGLPHTAYSAVADRLRKLSPRVRGLQKWRKWGADQHRQDLCEAMETLSNAEMSQESKASRLHDLQMEWKELDKAGSPVNHPLWDLFHALSEQVYESCKPYLERQAAERETNRQEREQLCSELEEFLDKVEWERMDWKKATHAEREMRQAWSAIGPVEGRHRKTLDKRFRSAMKRLDGHLTEERNRNQQLKRDLVSRVEALAEEPDLERAIEETKRLQRQWHTTVSARQKEENRLWQGFRAACDAVFARRREQHEAQVAELERNLQQREAICRDAETLADADSDQIAQGLTALESRWRDSEVLPIPRQAASRLNQRWREARSLVQRRGRERREQQRRESLDLLARQSSVCERLERWLETEAGEEMSLDATEAKWQALPKQRDAGLQAAIGSRFGAALRALREGDTTLRGRFAANGERRAELCLHLEVLARVDSPPELTKERLAFQVTRLKEHMRQGEKDPLEGASRLLQEWYVCGPAPASVAAGLEDRFRRARTALEKVEREHEAA
ncbi:MAG: DUF349 domain-containing protein [Pseudomonadota bacterium]|nr:DUF349 domain-containing protein [Pseudomonadota bacterium]